MAVGFWEEFNVTRRHSHRVTLVVRPIRRAFNKTGRDLCHCRPNLRTVGLIVFLTAVAILFWALLY